MRKTHVINNDINWTFPIYHTLHQELYSFIHSFKNHIDCQQYGKYDANNIRVLTVNEKIRCLLKFGVWGGASYLHVGCSQEASVAGTLAHTLHFPVTCPGAPGVGSVQKLTPSPPVALSQGLTGAGLWTHSSFTSCWGNSEAEFILQS